MVLSIGRLNKSVKRYTLYYADVAELADALDLGSSVPDVQVQVLSSAVPKQKTIDFRLWLFLFSI